MARNTFGVDEALEKEAEFNVRHLIRMKKYIKPYTRLLTVTLTTTLITSLLNLLWPFFLQTAIDDMIPRGDYGGIFLLAGVLLAAMVINMLFLKYRIISTAKVGQGIIRDLRLDLFRHLQKLPFSFYDSRPHGKILVRIVNYINSLSDLLSNGIINLLTDLFSLIVIVIAMLLLDVPLALASMAGLPLLLTATKIIKEKQRRAWRIQSAKASNMNAYIHESIAGIKVTQAFTREKTNQGIFEGVAGEVRSTWMKAVRVMMLMFVSVENISTWTVSFIYMCGIIWFTGADTTLGVLVAMVAYSSRFWMPIANIANIYNSIIVNMAYLERIFETMDEPVIVEDLPGAGVMKPIEGRVAFEEVTFSYEPGVPVLKQVSFTAEPGDTIALVGPTGAGKTTVVNLISRFYDLEAGTVRIDGADIKTVTLQSLRKQMGIMLQDSFIFTGTVMDNIRYGKLDASDDEVIEAAKTVMAHEFIMEMEEGYKTEVNERGSRLSSGQRQLIAFARALLADPKILILDEATSSIDTKTELALQEGLNRLLRNRTSFIIAHRLSTIRGAHRIMYIDKGTILESGGHDELMDRKGVYYQLVKSQYAFLEEAVL